MIIFLSQDSLQLQSSWSPWSSSWPARGKSQQSNHLCFCFLFILYYWPESQQSNQFELSCLPFRALLRITVPGLPFSHDQQPFIFCHYLLFIIDCLSPWLAQRISAFILLSWNGFWSHYSQMGTRQWDLVLVDETYFWDFLHYCPFRSTIYLYSQLLRSYKWMITCSMEKK